MKNLKIVFSAIFLLMNIAAFSINPPQVVINAFKAKFPDAKNVKWGKESKTEYEAEFSLENKHLSANFSIDGKWLETETEIAISELPEAVKVAIASKFVGYTITGASKIENSKSEIFYEADIKSKKHSKEVAFKEDGTLLK